MPDNPVVKDLINRAAVVKGNQDKLRAAMAEVAVKAARPAEEPAGEQKPA